MQKNDLVMKAAEAAVDIAGETNDKLKALKSTFDRARKAIIKVAQERSLSKIQGKKYRACVSASVQRETDPIKAFQYMIEAGMLEEEALAFFKVKESEFKKAFGDTTRNSMAEEKPVTWRVILKKLK